MSKTKYTLSFDIKPLNEEQYTEAPEAVRRVYISVLENIPLKNEELKSTIKTYPDYFTLKERKVKKSFGEKVKRLLSLKGALEKKSEGRKLKSEKFMTGPGSVEFSGEVTGEAAESVAAGFDALLQNIDKGLDQRALQLAFRNRKSKNQE